MRKIYALRRFQAIDKSEDLPAERPAAEWKKYTSHRLPAAPPAPPF